MSDDERFDFYAGCALIGLLSHHGSVNRATAMTALDMAQYMIDMKQFIEKDKENDN